jgi:protocatechuate 3,4-dioxygenase beta subunit
MAEARDMKGSRLITRREALGVVGSAAGAALAFGCGNSPTSPSSATSTTTTASTNAACAVTPTETIGPYPSLVDLFRSDVREGKNGTVLALTIRVVNAASGCAPVPNANVEIWHVDAAGDYSQYGTQTAQTFLRGIQTTNSNGEVTFTTIYPGWYQGRATHIHVEVTMGGRSIKVTQVAFPEAINNVVHASGVYASRGTNPMSNLADGILADSLSSEIVTPTGSVNSGYAATFQVGISA